MEIASWLEMRASFTCPLSSSPHLVLTYVGPCILPQSLGVPMCIGPVLYKALFPYCPLFPLALILFPPLLPHGSVRQEDRYLMETSCSGLRLQGLSISVYHLAAVLSISSHLRQKEAPLMDAQGTSGV